MANGTFGRLNADVRHDAQWGILCTSLDILHEAWPDVITDAGFEAAMDEDSITNILRQKMRAVKAQRSPPPEMRFEREAQSDAVDDDTPLGLIDIMVCYTWNEVTHLVIECKRIWSTDNSLALKYVREGVCRFASGKYSAGHALGAMVGYVLCGNAIGCIDRIKRTLLKEPVSVTGYDKIHGWKNTQAVVASKTLGRTKHTQKSHRYKISLLHTFVEVTSSF
ncbi:hypothetical protein [Planctomycetes bacterium TBK1r]|uniref:Restriction endonuclease type IV Mrr domain-containing protein n=1 Tax=Stieleria magnilauensis TaxID=2527963 RepID=A0ABX5XUX6_9BACT|nr:hypothetical protein TBK1r_48080 [Planctomycetes bacterium TBK1r]